MKKYFILLILLILLVPMKTENLSLDPHKKTISITFDDGPSGHTKKIVNLLSKYGYNATFFVVGEKAEKDSETVLYTYRKGNEIGNHTYSHIWSTKYKDKVVLDEIDKTNNIIHSITGENNPIFRPSYGAINRHLRNVVKNDIVLWTLDSNDWKIKNYRSIASLIVKNVKDGDIILMHDTYERSYDTLKLVLPILKRLDYQVVTVSTLKEIREFREKDGL